MQSHQHQQDEMGITEPMFPSPHWTLEATVTFDGLRGTANLDVVVSQWFTEKCMESWSSTTYPMDQLLERLLPELAEALTETCARVSPF